VEIREYVGALAGKGRIVAAVAIIAGFFAVVLFILQPQTYHANATVVLPIPPSTTTSALAAVSEAYADFAGAMTADVVAERAAQDAGVPVGEVKGHLAVSRLGDGSLAQVTYSGTDAEHATDIAKFASQEALAVVTAARLAPLEQQLTLAKAAYDEANTEYQQFVQTNGIYTDGYFTKIQGKSIDLQNELGAARASGDTARANQIQARIDQLNTTMSQNLADWQRLTSTRASALEAYTTAQQAELSEKGLLTSTQAGEQVTASLPTGASRFGGLIKAVVPAVVVAAGLAIGLIVLLEVVGPVTLPKRTRRPRAAAQDRSEDGDHGQGPEPPAAEDEDLDEDEEPARDPAGRIIRTTA